MVEVYVITIKQYSIPKQTMFIPIVAGAYKYDEQNFPSNYIRDDSGDNISIKNDLYSEFTANYWVWKNSKADIVGINHYRRYFINGGWFNYFICLLNPKKMVGKYILNEKQIQGMFNDFDCILPKKQWRANRTLREEFTAYNYSKGLLDAVRKIIQKYYNGYLKYFDSVCESYENYQKCICIMKREYYNSYSEWIFGIFEKLESMGYGGENREFAFLAERMQNVWVEYQKKENGMKVKEMFFVNMEYPIKGYFKNFTEMYVPKIVLPFYKMASRAGFMVTNGRGNMKIKKKLK